MSRPRVNDPNSRASRFRRRRFHLVERLIDSLLASREIVRILDVGGRRDYWDLLRKDLHPRVEITILNYLDNELSVGRRENDPITLHYVQGDARRMPQYLDRSFDLAHSNSVIEHVGALRDCQSFAREIRRVSDAYYVQTPYLWFPIDPHFGVPFIHWLPNATRAQLYSRYKIGYAARAATYTDAMERADHVNLLDQRFLREIFPDGRLIKERFGLMTKSLVMIRDNYSV